MHIYWKYEFIKYGFVNGGRVAVPKAQCVECKCKEWGVGGGGGSRLEECTVGKILVFLLLSLT